MSITIQDLKTKRQFYDTRTGEIVEIGDLSDNTAVNAGAGLISTFYPRDSSLDVIDVKEALRAFTCVTEASEVLFGRTEES